MRNKRLSIEPSTHIKSKALKLEPQKPKLGELKATAICGNDISSSCLYVSALTIIYAGQFAWISLLIVAGVLYLFRKIYHEVVGAIPLNGGAYNVLLNTTSKQTASFAACLTILSYMATAVISGNTAMHYLKTIVPRLLTEPATIVLLSIFMILAIMGIRESAKVAVVIFITHLSALTLLILATLIYLISNGFEVFSINWDQPVVSGNILIALFFGFSSAMLGISGFESSANYVEEQKPGVFPKTLRNMWSVVSFFNPVIALLALCVFPITSISIHKESLLSHMGNQTGGNWLSWIISADAVLVLCGAVLTAYIGVTGLVERITLDRIFPNYFLKKNKKGVTYRIIICFFILCTSVLVVTGGNLEALAGVYTFSFLSVMILFGIGNLLLKIKRGKLPRPIKAKSITVMLAILLVIAAFFGNMDLNRESFFVFIRYFVPSVVFILIMLNRGKLVKALLYLLYYLYRPVSKFVLKSSDRLKDIIDRINAQEFVFFTSEDDLAVLNRVMQYIEQNEITRRVKIVNVKEPGIDNEPLKKDLAVLDRAFPEINIEFVEVDGIFGPEIIEELSQKWNIPKNFMFIGSPGDKFPYRVSELGGVRLIM